MLIARLDKVSLRYGLSPLLEEADLQVLRGERVCLLGRNGTGKSSLLKLLSREIAPDSGEVWIRPGGRTASLAQEVSPASEVRVREVLRAGVPKQEEEWRAELEVDQIIARLELAGDARMSDLSGGWRRRVMLGRALVAQPDLLLLDEPTNHLDIETIGWLEEMMLEFPGALLFVSHDRAFIRRLAPRIVELDRGHLVGWSGGYDDYVLEKRAALDVEAKHAALFDKKLAQEEAWIRQGVEARRTRNEGRVRALKQLRTERRERRERLGQIDLKAQDAAPSGKLVFEASEVWFDFGLGPVIADFSTRIMRGDRIGIVGPNGCGKTTLIKLLMGELEPTRGSIRRGTSLMPAYFDQQRATLDPAASLMDNVTGGSGDTVTIDGRARHVSGYLRDFLFPPERLRAPVSMLSGGERNRLLLAKLFAKPSNLLIMDEPTNDLDAETLDLVEEMVADCVGTLLLVSHDRAFLDNVVTGTLVFEGGGRIDEYVGGYSDSMRQRGERSAAAPGATTRGATRRGASKPGATTPGATTPGATTPGATMPSATMPGATTPGATTRGATMLGATTLGATMPGASTPGANAPTARAAAAGKNEHRRGAAPAPAPPRSAPPAKPRKLSFNEQRELGSLPAVIERLEAEQTALQSSLSDPALFQERPAEARRAAARLHELMLELAAAYERWAALESTG